MSGGGGQTSTSSNAPPQQYLDAYSAVLARANQNASTPFQQYQGNLQADFSPLQQQGFQMAGAANGISAPYLNQAAQDYTNATASLTPSYQPQSDQASAQYTKASNTDLQGALSPYQQQAQQGFAAGSQAIDPTKYSADAIQGFESPYTQQVVDATQAQFNQQNAEAQTKLQGNAASQGALGGDRVGVAQAQLAGQQQMAQAPVLANLRNTGFNQAQQEFNNQQQTTLGAQQNTAGRQLTAAQGTAGLAGQSLSAAQQQAAIAQQAGAGFAGLGQMGLSAAQSQGWLNAQAASGMAGLGNQALSNTLAESSADLSAGAAQQAQAQTSLNIPYQQYLAQQSYPYQQTSWLSNIAQGLGSASGGTSSQTTPGPSAASQAAGLGVAAAGAYGAYANSNPAAASAPAAAAASVPYETGAYTPAASAADSWVARGGAIRGFAGGGGVPDLSVSGIPGGVAAPGGAEIVIGSGIPDAGASPIPSGGAPSGTSLMKRNYGTTSSNPGNGDSTLGNVLKAAGTVAATVYGGPAGGMAANALSQNVHFHRGGFARAPGGSVPVLPRGFASGGSAPITVASVADAQGRPVPMMTVAPGAATGFAGGAGSLDDQTAAYFAKNAAGISHAPPTIAPLPAAPRPDPAALGLAELAKMGFVSDGLNGDPGGGMRGGNVGGFAGGGDIGTEDPNLDVNDPDPPPASTTDPNVPRPSVHQRHIADRGFPAPPADHSYDVPQPSLWDRLTTPARAEPATTEAPAPPAPRDPNDLDYDAPLLKQFGKFYDQYRAHQAALQDEARKVGLTPSGSGAQPTATPPGKPDNSDPWAGRGSGASVGDNNAPPAASEFLTPSDGALAGQSVGQDATSAPPAPAAPPPAGQSQPRGEAGGFAHEPGAPPPSSSTGTPSGPSDGTAAASPSASPGFGAKQDPARKRLEDSSDDLKATRALQEDRASPWLSLMQAGFGMMAGNSPHALQNIGAGASQGLAQYVSSDRAAKDLAARVDENRVRLKETQAYREATTGAKDTMAQASMLRATTGLAAEQAKSAWYQAKAANPSMSAAQLRDHVMQGLQQSTNPATGQPYTAGEAYAFTGGLDTRAAAQQETARSHGANEALSGERNQIAFSRVMSGAAADQAKQTLAQSKLDEGTKTAILSEAGRNVVGDLTGKKTLQGEVDALVKARTGMASPTGQGSTQPPAAQQNAAPQPAPPLPKGLPPGSQYSASRQMWRDPSGKLYDKNGNAA